MVKPNEEKGAMTQAEELAELRRWLREDVANLHRKLDEREARLARKIDQYITENSNEHEEIRKQINLMDKKNAISTTKIATKVGIMVAVLSVIFTGIASAAIHRYFY